MKENIEKQILELLETEQKILTLENQLEINEIDKYRDDFFKNVFIHYLK